MVPCLIALLAALSQPQTSPAETPVVASDSLLTTQIGGLERTGGTAAIVEVAGQSFKKALRVRIQRDTAETNETQLTIPNSAPVRKGDVLLATFYLRGKQVNGSPARVEFLFERATDPWTKSASVAAAAPKEPDRWKRIVAPFAAAESYQPGEAMASLRLAFGPQTVELGGLSLVNYGTTKRLEDLVQQSTNAAPIGSVRVKVDLKQTHQMLLGFGGNFCQPRYGATEPLDPVGAYNVKNLRVACARVGLPLEKWTPEPGVYREDAQARACLLQMQAFKRRGIPLIVSIWEGPAWMLGGRREQMGRMLPPERVTDCIEAIGKFLVTGRDKYSAHADYFSFNEADFGVNFKFTPAQIAAFIRQAGPRFKALGLHTKFLLGDTANGAGFLKYAPPLLRDREIAPYLGPLAFHCWDALSASDSAYQQIAALGRKAGKEIWCTEAGHDAQLWQARDPWSTWTNALGTAQAYEKTLRLTGASVMLYWTYEDNYPLVSKDGSRPYPIWHVMKQMEGVLRPGWRIATAATNSDDLHALPAVSSDGHGFSILLINPAGGGRAALGGLPGGANLVAVTSTAGAQRQKTALRVGPTGRLTVPIPARSVVTLITATARD